MASRLDLTPNTINCEVRNRFIFLMFNQLHNSIRKYFGISRTETNGIFILLILTICIIFSPLLYNHLFKGGYTSCHEDSVKLDSILQILMKNQDSLKATMNPMLKDSLFFFNPNEMTYPQMILLGFDSILAQRVMKFRDSKGRFYVKRDLLKIYGLPEELYTRLADFISLPDTIMKEKQRYDNYRIKPKSPVSDGRTELVLLNINVADTNDLKRIKGIGSVLSARIIKYRDLLGGYSNINQLDDVYGLKGRSLENLKYMVYVDSLFIPEKIRINFTEWEELVRHPYINSQMANDIINLRSEKGYLNNINDLKDITYMNDSILNQLEPYFEF